MPIITDCYIFYIWIHPGSTAVEHSAHNHKIKG